MPNYLIVPIQIDMLYVPAGEYSVLDQKADFSILPFVDQAGYDTNSHTANLSEMILSQPFENPNLRLGQGAHLHWAMPDALTRGEETSQGTVFPEVPNRWLVIRKNKGQITKQWIVESDYLFPEGINKEGSAISVPYGKGKQPYRFMGRNMPLSLWQEKEAERYSPFTALGYGEATFAAFYPNCFSVFGFYDQSLLKLSPDIEYEILGWYSDANKDPLAQFVAQPTDSTISLSEAILEQFDWQLPEGNPQVNALLCYASLKVDSQFDTTLPAASASPSITVANTPSEALSAHLANKFAANEDPTNRTVTLQQIEDQLEAVQMSATLNQKQLDLVSRFKEIRHENSFQARSSGLLWSVSMETQQPVTEESLSAPSVLPNDILDLLDKINPLQQTYDKNLQEIESLKQQLFADWYKYMVALYPPNQFNEEYPPVDQIKAFIEENDIPPLNKLIKKTGTLIIQEDASGIFSQVTTEASAEDSLATQLTQWLKQLIALVTSKNEMAKGKIHYLIKRTPTPRFWEPNEPVVLIEGDGVTITQRHGQDGTLTGVVFQSDAAIDNNQFEALSKFLQKLPESFGQSIFTKQPWSPFLLEWEANFYPLESLSNIQKQFDSYNPDFLRNSYEAPVTSHGLELKKGAGKVSAKASIYIGESLLTDQSPQLLQQQIENHWEKQGLIAAYQQETGIPLSLPTDLKAFANWYNAKASPKQGIQIQIQAYQEVIATPCLTQSLSGFNQALLNGKQTMEMLVEDPLGFWDNVDSTNYQKFSDSLIRDTIGDSFVMSPSPMNDFHPLRAGALKLAYLRLVDTFGQTKLLNCEKIHTTYKMRSPGSTYLIQLPPRIVQPARLNFDYLAASQETNKFSEDKTPDVICGWFLANQLDRSLMVYDAKGQALGYFKAGQWREAIDSDQAKSIRAIENPHLQRTANFILNAIEQDPNKTSEDEDQHFLSYFIKTIEDALENICPELHSEQQGLSLLVGRPVAVIRASIDLELMGMPAVSQRWSDFQNDLEAKDRTTDAFTRVKFPVRLGEYGQLNDGLIGYWLEAKSVAGAIEFQPDLFYSPQSDFIDTDKIESQFDSPGKEDGPINFFLSLDAPPQNVTLLMDPRGSVHATVGVLPNQEISIPTKQYQPLLDQMEVTFLNAPIITNQDQINLPLPINQGYSWSWVARKTYTPTETWSELFTYGEITQATFIKAWTATSNSVSGESLWAYLVRTDVAWLVITDASTQKAKVLAKNKRQQKSLAAPFMGLEQPVEDLFDIYAEHIEEADLKATFSGPKAIKEGWLKLRKSE